MSKVATAEVMRFMTDCLKVVGVLSKTAKQQAELLISADKYGHPSHGLYRLPNYIEDIQNGICYGVSDPVVLHETESTAFINGNNALGAAVSHYATDIAIKKAEETGIAWVVVKGSNHNGMAGFWARKIAENELIGMAFTNSSPLLAPTRSKMAALGVNPISVVAPASDGEYFYLDMTTSTVPFEKLYMLRREGVNLPSGWAQGPNGKETLDPDVAIRSGCLMPLGGGEQTAGYKGFGLAAMVELFCGMLAGSAYGHHVRDWYNRDPGTNPQPANLGQCFVAVDPECFAPGLGDRLTDCIQHWRQLEPMNPDLPVLAPGDKEMKAAADNAETDSVTYSKEQLEVSAALAGKLQVEPMILQTDKKII